MSRLLLYIFSILVVLGGISCSTTRLEMDLPDTEIPSEAETAVVISGIAADQLFTMVNDSLTQQGYLIDQSNKDLYTISTRSRNIGQNKQIRMSFLIEPLGQESSRMTVRGEWRSIPDPAKQSEDMDAEEIKGIGWESATWSGPKASKRAFGYIVKFIHRLPYEKITYN